MRTNRLVEVINKIGAEVATREELTNMTVVELKAKAKEAGITGYSKMKKAELVAALEAKEILAKEMLNMIQEQAKMASKVKPEAFKAYTLSRMIKDGATSEEINEYLDRVVSVIKRQHKAKRINVVKKFAKRNDIVLINRAEFDVIKTETSTITTQEVYVQPASESSITRNTNKVEGVFADKNMVLKGIGTYDILNLSFGGALIKGFKNGTKDEQRFCRQYFNQIYSLINGTNDERVSLRINMTTGAAHVELDRNAALNEDEFLVTYDFLCISPSGLRTASVMLGAISTRYADGTVVEHDRREEILDKSLDGAFKLSFRNKDGLLTALKDMIAMFKALSRLAMGAPGSKELFEVRTYVVMKNLAEGAVATFNGKELDASNTKDGNVEVAAEELFMLLNNAGIPARFNDIVGLCDQLRGAGLKCSGTYKTRRDMVAKFKHFLSKGNKIAYIVVDGKRFDSVYDKDGKLVGRSAMGQVIDAGLASKLFAEMQMLADTNAMKLTKHNPTFKLVQLKTAYESDTSLNMVVNMAMLLADPEAAYKLLMERGMEYLRNSFKELGITFSINEEGEIETSDLDFESVKSLNNEAQFSSYLYKSEPAKVAAAFPGVVRSIFSNKITGIKNLINYLKIPVDSLYTVVQADESVQFGFTVLQEDEVFSQELEEMGVTKISALRHPISSTSAVTTLNVVGIKEVLVRIANANVSDEIKAVVSNAYVNAKGYIIIPASHFLMEKHDGMDFDIDAMQIILDKEIVEILSKIPNRGSVISDTEFANKIRRARTEEENHIEAFMNGQSAVLTRPVNPTTEVKEEKKAVTKKFKFAKGATSREAKKVYDLGFHNVSELVRNYLIDPIASVGEIATAFYNNALLYIALKSNEVSQEEKDAVVASFKKYYGCNANGNAYVSKIDRTAKSFEVNKLDCTEAVYKFAESRGTQEDLELFLLDCCDYNRYLAETSIDSAKNKFYIINMFMHSFVAQGLGSDKNMEIIEVKGDAANAVFSNNCEMLDRNSLNFFELPMISFSRRSKLLSELEGGMDDIYSGEYKGALAVVDPLAKIRLELVEYANVLIACTAKLLEDYVKSPEADLIRRQLVTAGSIDEKSGVDAALNGVKNAYATLTSTVKEHGEEFEGKMAKDYLKNVAIDGCRNMATLAFYDRDEYTIGYYVARHMINGLKLESNCGTMNPALIQVFEKEICSFLAAEGFDNVGYVGEKISYANQDSKMIALSSLEGQAVTFERGIARLDEITIVSDNKKANIEGTIVNEEGRYVVKAEKSFREIDASKGIYFNADSRYAINHNVTDVVSYKFKPYFDKKFNGLYAVSADGEETFVASITINKESAEILETIELTPDNLKKFTNERGRTVFYLSGVESAEIINSLGQAPEVIDFGFTAPALEGFTVSTPESNSAEAFDMSQFNAPSFQ